MSDQDEQQTPQFGGGGKQETEQHQEPQQNQNEQSGARFTEEDIEKILSRNSHAQQHIRTLESETAELRQQLQQLQEELGKSKSIDDLLEAMRQQDEETNMPGSTAPQLDKNELLAQLKEDVFAELNQAERARLEQQNWQETERLLREKYGEKYGFYVDERAKELDMTNEEMEALARTKPKVFMELIGERQSKASTPSPTQSSERSTPRYGDADIEIEFRRVAQLRKNPMTEEGREAARRWADPGFQARYRQHILEKARKEGSQFNNLIR